jgi:hypothetical protein
LGIACAGFSRTGPDCSSPSCPRIALDSRDFIVWLALLKGSRVVPLAFVEVVVVVALLVIVALGQKLVLLIRLVSPSRHHVVELHGGCQTVASEVVVGMLRGKAVLEAADDVLVGDVGDGGAHHEEALGVGS